MKGFSMRTKTIFVTAAILSLALATGCEKKPPKAAKAALAKALDALKAKDLAGFKAQVVPDQRDKVVFDKSIALGQASFKEVPLEKLMAMPFFSTFTGYSIKNGYVDSKTETKFLVLFDFPKGYTGSTYICMSKTKEGWKVNMKKSVLAEKSSNGASAYSAMKFKK